MKQTMTAMANAANKVAQQQLAQTLGSFPGGGSSGPGAAAAQKYAASILGAYGWGASQMPPLIALWNGESGWNYQAYNGSSGATGIPQALPGYKMAAAGADWRTNPATQIRWGLGYIRSVYGSPANAYATWLSRSPHWYGKGLHAIADAPTVIGVGESGRERVDVTPLRGRSAGTGTGGTTGLYVAGDLVVRDRADAEFLGQRAGFAVQSAGFGR